MISGHKSKKQKIIEKSIEIALSSTSHGIPNVFRAEKTILKLMWLLLFLAGTSVGIYTVVKSIMNYLDYEVVTSIKSINEMPTEFPAVTFFILRNNKANISFKTLKSECFYNKFACKDEDIQMNQDELGFISYTFTSQQAYQRGIQFGLQIDLNLTNISIDFDTHITHIMIYNSYNNRDGIRVIIHNQTLDPNYYAGYSDNGLNVAPGFSYEIAVKRTYLNKLEQPYNNCLKDVKSIDSFDSDLYRYHQLN